MENLRIKKKLDEHSNLAGEAASSPLVIQILKKCLL